MSIEESRNEISRVGASLFERGYVHGTAGNISVRLEGEAGLLITPTDACLGFLEPSRLAHVACDGTHLAGDRPSKTLALHRRIYAADETGRCIIHTHSRNLVALSLRGPWRGNELLPPITPYFVMKVGHVPLVPYHRPGDPAVGDLISALIRQTVADGLPLNAVVLERLGPTVWHRSPAEAMATLEELEETAFLWRTAVPSPSPLGEAELDELNRAFGRRW